MRIVLSSLIVVAMFGAACSNDDGSDMAAPDPNAASSSPHPATDETRKDQGESTTSFSSSSVPATTSTIGTTSTIFVVPDPDADATAPVTTLPASVGLPDPDDGRVNEGGIPITLDETAALACANAQFARDSINFDNLGQAEIDLNAAADRAEPSEQHEIAEAADPIRSALDSPDPLAVVEAFLAVCVDNGHQI